MTVLKGTCHCGAVQITIPTAPDYVNDCNCSLCATHGTLWGYFDPAVVTVQGETQIYTRSDREAPAVSLHFCGTCGCTTHWTLTEAFAQRPDVPKNMGTNMHLFDPVVLRGVEIRFPDGRGWDWTGAMPYRRKSEVG